MPSDHVADPRRPIGKPSAPGLLVAAGLLCVLANPAMAQTDGWYMGAEVGVNMVPHIGFDALTNSWQQSHNTGFGLVGQAGYGFGQVRLEGEIGYRQNDINRISNNFGQQSAGGNIGGMSVMGNAYYDFNTGGKLTPYLGAGVGGLDLSANHITAGGLPVTNGSEFVLAYQGIAGLSYAINERLSLKGDYRYLRSERANLSLDPGYGPGNGSGSYMSHAILVGFTYKFGQPEAKPAAAALPMPPAPAPVMAPPPPAKPVVALPVARNFMVFFDWDQDVITPEAKAIITQAAEAARKNHSAVIALTGYTDRSGTVPYNLKLSVRRGEAVKKLLLQLNIAAGEITVVGKGESDPLVPTADGVREAQNRRVTILLE